MADCRVLSVGQCVPDHYAIEDVLNGEFGAVVDEADTARAAVEAVGSGAYDLVLVNRVLDADGDSGVELIRVLKAAATTRETPVMLVSNYEDAQREAVSLGAESGFGKASLRSRDTLGRLATILRKSDPAAKT